MRRLPGLLVGLVGFGLGIALMAQSGLGLGPWEVLNQGVGLRLGIPMGSASILLGIPILLCWIPLREWPGPGTLINIVLIGLSTNLGLLLFPSPPPDLWAWRLAQMAAGILVIGVASGRLPRRRPWPRAARRPDDRRPPSVRLEHRAGAAGHRGLGPGRRLAARRDGRHRDASPSRSASGQSCRSRWASSTAMAGSCAGVRRMDEEPVPAEGSGVNATRTAEPTP